MPREQREIMAADAQTFEAIVRSQLTDSANISFLRVDVRPAGDKDILPGPTPSAAGFDADSTNQAAVETNPDPVTDQRKAILGDLHVEEGGPFFFPRCGGSRTERSESSSVHAKGDCPTTFRRYVTVGLPTRGAAAVLNKARRPEAPAPDTTGELWTVLVTESSIGPGGQQWRQYAWLFRREPHSERLGVSEKFLLSWAE